MSRAESVLVAVPSMGTWDEQFAMCLMGMVINGLQHTPVNVHSHVSSMLFQSRQRLAEKAIAGGFTHLLMVDSDQTFPHDLLRRWLGHRRSVIAANIATKAEPPQETACQRGFVPTSQARGLERVWRVGTGIMMVKTSVFDLIPKPWFPTRWIPELDKWQGEDWGFCELLERAGIDIWIDHDVSREVGHRGPKEYTLPRYKENLIETP